MKHRPIPTADRTTERTDHWCVLCRRPLVAVASTVAGGVAWRHRAKVKVLSTSGARR